jgi:hypothetical protein
MIGNTHKRNRNKDNPNLLAESRVSLCTIHGRTDQEVCNGSRTKARASQPGSFFPFTQTLEGDL